MKSPLLLLRVLVRRGENGEGSSRELTRTWRWREASENFGGTSKKKKSNVDLLSTSLSPRPRPLPLPALAPSRRRQPFPSRWGVSPAPSLFKECLRPCCAPAARPCRRH